jgi:hypothetical protein
LQVFAWLILLKFLYKCCLIEGLPWLFYIK